MVDEEYENISVEETEARGALALAKEYFGRSKPTTCKCNRLEVIRPFGSRLKAFVIELKGTSRRKVQTERSPVKVEAKVKLQKRKALVE